MSQTVRIDVVTDEQEAALIVARNTARGYTSQVETIAAIRWDGSDLGGSVDILRDLDNQAWLVVGRKP